MAHHLLVDHILAMATTAAMNGKFSLHIQHCLADFNLSPTSSQPLLGPADDIFSATHALTCRLPSTSSWARNYRFDTFSGADTDTLPDFVRHIDAVVVDLDPNRPPVPLGSAAPGGASTIASSPRKKDASTVCSLFGGSRAFDDANTPPPKPPRPTDGTAKRKAPSSITITSNASVASPPTKKKGAYFDPFLHLSRPSPAAATQWFTPAKRAAEKDPCADSVPD